MKDQIINLITESLKSLGLPNVEFTVEHPQLEAHGDYATNVAMVLFPQVKDTYHNPRDLAQKIVDSFTLTEASAKGGLITNIEVAGPGFINFTLNQTRLMEEMNSIINNQATYGTNQSMITEKVVVEYTDPNPFKEFHIGHLYSNGVGESIARILEASGADVWRADYFGDIGLHVSKSIWGMFKLLESESKTIEDYADLDITARQRFLGKCYAFGSTQFESDPAAKSEIEILNTHLYAVAQELMVENDGWQKKIDYDQYVKEPQKYDRQLLKKLYKLGKAWSLEYFETIYKRLGTQFKGYYPESKVSEIGYEYVIENLAKGIFEKSQDAVVFPGEKYGLHTRVFINKNNLPTYEAKELGLAPTKYQDFPYTKSLIITGNEINEYFKVLITALKLINPQLGNVTTHIGHGMVRLPEGKMSSRTGKVITGDSLVDEAKNRALVIINDLNPNLPNKEIVADQIGIAAIKFAFLKSNIGSDITFTFEEALSFTGMSGPYLQYTYARCRSVLSKSLTESSHLPIFPSSGLNVEELSILRWLYQYPEIVKAAAQAYAPHMICQYLYELAGRFNTFYNQHSILGTETNPVEPSTRIMRLALTQATSVVLKNGLSLLGIIAPEKM